MRHWNNFISICLRFMITDQLLARGLDKSYLNRQNHYFLQKVFNLVWILLVKVYIFHLILVSFLICKTLIFGKVMLSYLSYIWIMASYGLTHTIFKEDNDWELQNEPMMSAIITLKSSNISLGGNWAVTLYLAKICINMKGCCINR